jgi:Caspase domain
MARKPEKKVALQSRPLQMLFSSPVARTMRNQRILCHRYVLFKTPINSQDGQATGAMSWAFREVLTRQPNQSYASLLQNVRELLAARYNQKPVLSASHPIDTKLRFVI